MSVLDKMRNSSDSFPVQALFAVVIAAQVNGKWASGYHAGAVDASAKAKKFAIIALVLGIVATVLYIILMVAGVVSTNSTSTGM